MSIEAMKQALDALTTKSHDLHNEWGGPWNGQTKLQELKNKAITSLRQAIETAEKQESDDLTIAYMSGFHDGKNKDAPQRTWVGLTDEDMRLCLAVADYNQGRYKRTQYWAHLATAIETKLREKNGC